MKIIPQDYVKTTEVFCSNFDGVIAFQVTETLKTSKTTAEYPAWDWFGRVWYEDNMFHCQIMKYGAHVDTVSAETPEQLRTICCEKHGSE